MLSIAQVSKPCLELRGVVFLDGLTVGHDAGSAGEGGPLAAAVKEGDVDVGVRLKVVGLAGFGVGVEDEIETAAFLQCYKLLRIESRTRVRYLAGYCHAATD